MSDIDNKIEKIKAIKSGKGIQSLLNKLNKIFDNPMAIFDTEYNLIAYTSDYGDDPLMNELVANGNYSYESQIFFMEEGFGDAVANAKLSTFLISDRTKYDRILGKLFNENRIYVANFLMVASNHPFQEGEQEAFDLACKLLTNEIVKSEFYQTYGSMH